MVKANYSKLRKFDFNKDPPPSLLKWIGNKNRIAKKILQYAPYKYHAYVEPFLGSGAILGTLSPKEAIAGDNLKPLIEIWQLLQNNPNSLLKHYSDTWDEYIESPKETYEKVKDEYNKHPNPHYLLFISRSCYGGVIRFTKQGTLSTPIGAHRPISPKSLEKRMGIWRKRVKNTTFIHADFQKTMELANAGDLVYCDPPYQYSQQILYGSQDFRIRNLWKAIKMCKNRGAKVMLSIDGKVKSKKIDLKLDYPKGLFEREILIDRGSSMLRRFQKKNSTMVGETVHDRLLLTWSSNSEEA